MTLLAFALGLLFGSALSAIMWQHLRYLRLRRRVVDDRQRLLYPASAFHVVTLLEIAPPDDVIESVSKLKELLETSGRAQVVYAGKGIFNAVRSAQIPEVRWNAVLLVQYASHADYETLCRSKPYKSQLAGFRSAYACGMKRMRLLNLALPTLLLARRGIDLARRRPARLPFVPAGPAAPDRETPAWRADSDGEGSVALQAERELGKDAVVVINLLKGGTAAQRAADRAYGLEMFGLFAEGGHGPMHVGRAVRTEGDASFDRVVLVFYPGVEYLTAMSGSSFFAGIENGKQPGDSLAVVTVPILSKLRAGHASSLNAPSPHAGAASHG